MLLQHAQPVGERVARPGVRVELSLLDGRHGRVDQVAPGRDAQPGDEEAAQEQDVEPAEKPGDRDVCGLSVGVGNGGIDVGARLQEAELLGEQHLADHVRGGEGEELVEVDGRARGGVLVEPGEKER